MLSDFFCDNIGCFCGSVDPDLNEMIDWTDKTQNYNERIKFLVLHHTVSDSPADTIAAFNAGDVSSHYIVGKDGDVYKVVEEEKRAWHAGKSNWENRSALNDTSIGIEIVNTGDEPFSDAQVDAVAKLSKSIVQKYGLDEKNIVGHSDIAPGRKFDPSGYFDWQDFYNKIGAFDGLYDSKLTPDGQKEVLLDWRFEDVSQGLKNSDQLQDLSEEILFLQKRLAKYGYKIDETAKYDDVTKNVVESFNRHFAPEIFAKEKIEDKKVVQNKENQRWYGISEERLNFLLDKLNG